MDWNEGAVAGTAYFHLSSGTRTVVGPYVIGTLDAAWQIENGWANDHGNAGAAVADEGYNPIYGRNCQAFEGGSYCDDGSFHADLGFNDVAQNNWALRCIGWAKREGVVGGYGDGTFRPNNAMARDELAKVLVTSLGLSPSTGTRHYCDVDPSYWAYSYIEILYGLGIMSGQPGASCGFSSLYFYPHNNIRRGEMAADCPALPQWQLECGIVAPRQCLLRRGIEHPYAQRRRGLDGAVCGGQQY